MRSSGTTRKFVWHPHNTGGSSRLVAIAPGLWTIKNNTKNMTTEEKSNVEAALKKLRKECSECGAPGPDPCRGCPTNTEKNELLKQLSK